MTRTQLLFIVILIEGYVVLASELLAMRQLIPFVGSGTEIIAIVISAVLMPLAVGYHYGGHVYRHKYKSSERYVSVRKILIKNIISALIVLGTGLSYLFMATFFEILNGAGIHNRMIQTTIYVSFFLVWPVFLLGQTVPLVSHYFSRRKLSEITGKMLFFSTTGSFLGSVFTTIVLMSLIGVHNSVIVTTGLLALLVPLLSKKLFCYEMLVVSFMLVVIISMNNDQAISKLGIVSNNAYNTIAIRDMAKQKSRIMVVNHSRASRISEDFEKNFGYWKFMQKRFIEPISKGNHPPKKILAIGAGGFTIGRLDKHNHYTFVDIDPDLKDVSEKYFLKEKLSKNKKFSPLSARAFLMQDSNQYDLIFIDAYTNTISIPAECTTKEFLEQVKGHLKPGGIVVSNAITNPTFNEAFTVRYYNTFRAVFPQFITQVIGHYNPWNRQKDRRSGLPAMKNVLYIYFDNDYVGDDTIYTDNLNTYSLDR